MPLPLPSVSFLPPPKLRYQANKCGCQSKGYISLTAMMSSTRSEDCIDNDRIRQLKASQAISVFQATPRAALDVLTIAETSPDIMLSLYPESIAGELATESSSHLEGTSSDSFTPIPRPGKNASPTTYTGHRDRSKRCPLKICAVWVLPRAQVAHWGCLRREESVRSLYEP